MTKWKRHEQGINYWFTREMSDRHYAYLYRTHRKGEWLIRVYEYDDEMDAFIISDIETDEQAMARANLRMAAFLAERKEMWSRMLSDWNLSFGEEDDNEQDG